MCIDPNQHPREPAGGPSGGQFAAGGESVTETPAFKAWFGGSKVVNDAGRPLVVYHGTNADFPTFNTGERIDKMGRPTLGAHFSADAEYAGSYGSATGDISGRQVMPVFLRIENPFTMNDTDGSQYTKLTSAEFLHSVKQAGHDGIIYNWHDAEFGHMPGHEIVVFSPTQIKSAIGNRGTFDPKKPSIIESRCFYAPRIGQRIALSRFAQFREAAPKKAPQAELFGEFAVPEDDDLLGMQVDKRLAVKTWSGTSFADRTVLADTGFQRDLVAQVERSLVAQERYDDFESRLFKQLGIETDEPAGALRDLETRLVTENRIAWNEGTISANSEGDEDTVLVYRSRLLPSTTPGCAAAHSMLQSDIPEIDIPRHFGCFCDWLVVPNPNSADPDTAAAGQAILDEMRADREDWGASEADLYEEASVRPSRLPRLREVAALCCEGDFDPAKHPREPAGGPGGGQFAAGGSEEGLSYIAVGGGGRAPRGGVYVDNVHYMGGQFLPEELPAKKSRAVRNMAIKAAVGLDRYSNMAELTIEPGSAVGGGGYWVKGQIAGQGRLQFMHKKPFPSKGEAVEFARAFVQQRNEIRLNDGYAAHPTTITVIGDDAIDAKRVKEAMPSRLPRFREALESCGETALA